MKRWTSLVLPAILLCTLSSIPGAGCQRKNQTESHPTTTTTTLPATIADAGGPAMVLIPAGKAVVGSSAADDAWLVATTKVEGWMTLAKDEPLREIDVAAFYVGKYEVTNEEYKSFVDATGRRVPRIEGLHTPYDWSDGSYPSSLGRHPVVLVSQEDARAYCSWLSRRTGKAYRLPTAAEWEKAASWDVGTKKRLRFPWGNEYDRTRYDWLQKHVGRAAISSHGIGPKVFTMPAGSMEFDQSRFGVFDMGENVTEWVAESGTLKGGSFVDIGGMGDGNDRNYSILHARSANAWKYPGDDKGMHIWRGLRVARGPS